MLTCFIIIFIVVVINNIIDYTAENSCGRTVLGMLE